MRVCKACLVALAFLFVVSGKSSLKRVVTGLPSRPIVWFGVKVNISDELSASGLARADVH